MISTSPIRTKASRLKKMLPVNQFEEIIFQYNMMEKKPTNYICSEDCFENIINDYEALVFYITHGFKPNWLTKETLFEPQSILLSLYSNYANLFVEFIRSLKDDSNLLTRVIKLIDRNTFYSNCSFHLEVNSHSDFAEMNMDWFLKSSIVNGEQ